MLLLWLVRELKTNLCLIGPPWTEKVYSREEWMSGEAREMDLLKLHITMVVRKESRDSGWGILSIFNSLFQGGDRLLCSFSIIFSWQFKSFFVIKYWKQFSKVLQLNLFYIYMSCNRYTTTSGLQKCALHTVWSHVQINRPLLTCPGMFIH